MPLVQTPRSDPKSSSLIQKVGIYSELPIPSGCYSIAIYQSLKHTLQDVYGSTPWFHLKFSGFATQLWTFEARLQIGVTMIQRNFARNFEPRSWTALGPTCHQISSNHSKQHSTETEKRCKSKKMLHLSRKINRIHGRETDSPTLKTSP